jgi:hypothetical protein
MLAAEDLPFSPSVTANNTFMNESNEQLKLHYCIVYLRHTSDILSLTISETAHTNILI